MAKDGSETVTNVNITSSSLSDSDTEDLQRMPLMPSYLTINNRYLSKQLSMCETSRLTWSTSRDIAWEERRRQTLHQEKRKKGIIVTNNNNGLTDEDLHELKGCIELGFGFNEEEGQKLCNTLPALDFYFAVNRQLSPTTPVPTPQSGGRSSSAALGCRSSCFESPRTEPDLKICSPGDNPQQVKTRLRHWAQAVACSLMQSY